MSDKNENPLLQSVRQDQKKKLCNEAITYTVDGTSETDKGKRHNNCMRLPEQEIKEFLEQRRGPPKKTSEAAPEAMEPYAPSVPNILPRGPKQLS